MLLYVLLCALYSNFFVSLHVALWSWRNVSSHYVLYHLCKDEITIKGHFILRRGKTTWNAREIMGMRGRRKKGGKGLGLMCNLPVKRGGASAFCRRLGSG